MTAARKFSMARARADAVRASWGLRYLPVRRSSSWRERSACRGVTPLFYADGAQVQAIAVCELCPVRLECLQDAAAVETEPGTRYVFGVRGGFTAAERDRFRRAVVAA